MHQEKYNLHWHTYSDHLREMFHEMMKSDELTDVTLVCDDKKQFKAHKIVLSACSSVFKSIRVFQQPSPFLVSAEPQFCLLNTGACLWCLGDDF